MTIGDTIRRDLIKSKVKSGNRNGTRTTASDTDLDKHLVSSSKQVLLKHVTFERAQKDISFHLQDLRGKYVQLNLAKVDALNEVFSKSFSNKIREKMNGQGDGPKSDGIPPPKQVLCQPDMVCLEWQKSHRVGSGLINMGNTCFLNSTLQCLTYTAPLANYLLSQKHKEECRAYGFCILCDLYTHIQRAFQHHGQAIRPMNMIHKLKSIAKHMHIGRQEDAHEFLRYVIEAMQKSCLSGYDKLDRYSKETSPVHQIFGGYYRSRVVCAACQGKSDTFDPFLDIGLEIKHMPSVTKALGKLVQPEVLEGDNAYQCKRCNRKVQAQKRFTVHRCPNVLTLCLKRFEYSRFSMGKINKEVHYSECLNLRPYMSDNKGPAVIYQLYAVLKHEGASCNSGHYYCYVRAPNQSWYCMNDSYVSQTSLQRVLNQNAYVLFYIRKPQKSNYGGSNQEQVQQPNKHMPKTATIMSTGNKTANPHHGPMGTPINRPKSSSGTGIPHVPLASPKLKVTPEPEKKPQTPAPAARHNMPQSIPPPGRRDRLSFVFKSKGVGSVLQSLQAGHVGSNGSTTNAKLGDKTSDSASVGKMDSTVSIKKVFPGPDKLQQTGKGGPDFLSRKSKVHTPSKPQEKDTSSGVTCTLKKEIKSSSLVPYGNDDESSGLSSDSDTNYDVVVEKLSKSSSKDAAVSTSVFSRGMKESIGDSNMRPPSWENGKKSALASSTNLTTIRKTDSPLKLTITTNGNAQRIMSTTPWRVTDSDQQVSPSVTSDSSNHSNLSTNSTSEWAVNDKKDANSVDESIKKEASHVGWNVKPSPSCNGGSGMFKRESGENRKTVSTGSLAYSTGQKNPNTSDNVKSCSPLLSSSTKVEKSYASKREKLGIVPKHLNGMHDTSDRTRQSSSDLRIDTMKSGGCTIRENDKLAGKVFFTHQHPDSYNVKEGVKNDEQQQGMKFDDAQGRHSVSKDFAKAKNSQSSSLNNEKEEGDQVEWKQDIKRLNDEDTDKKKKKKTKFAPKKEEEKVESPANGQSEKHVQKKKGLEEDKAHKLPEGDAFRKHRGHSKSRTYRSDSDSDPGTEGQFRVMKNGQPRNGPFKRHSTGPLPLPDVFRSPPDSDYDDDSSPVLQVPPFESYRKRKYREHGYDNSHSHLYHEAPNPHWYRGPPQEKKKQLNGYGDCWTLDKPKHKQYRQEGYSQNWDHYDRGSFPMQPHRDGSQRLNRPWDGTNRSSSKDVTDFLNKSSLKTYGASVESWEGGCSTVDMEVAKEARGTKRRNAWDHQYDIGKVKKQRKPFHQKHHYSGHHSPFQRAQTHRNKQMHSWNFSGYNQQHMKKSRPWHDGQR
ncbi:uncharacterized protein [Diadema setosum]|uniref:uncharacterized protein n=1 Tax=Diadema setosum TaxID=31175 RepID=UPI003B3BC719